MLEIQIGMIGWAAKNGRPWTDDWMDVAGANGAAVKLCKNQLGSMDPALADDVRALLADADPVFRERNKFAHAVFTLDLGRPAGEQWVLKSARGSEFKPLTDKEGNVLVVTANRLSKRAKALSTRAADRS